MKVHIDEEGIMHVSSETNSEAVALTDWCIEKEIPKGLLIHAEFTKARISYVMENSSTQWRTR